jgi:hypothetical protein
MTTFSFGVFIVDYSKVFCQELECTKHKIYLTLLNPKTQWVMQFGSVSTTLAETTEDGIPKGTNNIISSTCRSLLSWRWHHCCFLQRCCRPAAELSNGPLSGFTAASLAVPCVCSKKKKFVYSPFSSLNLLKGAQAWDIRLRVFFT